MNNKIKSHQELLPLIEALKNQNKIIVTTGGSFDMLHIGHIKSLQEAKGKGDILIVLVNSDQSIKKYKGPRRPIIPENQRMEMIAALECVDYVVGFNEVNPKAILEKIKPNVYCNAANWSKIFIEKEVVEKNNGKIHVLKHQSNISTSDIIKKINNIHSIPATKAIFLDRDGVINHNNQGYIHKVDDFEFTPYAFEALQKISETDYKIIIITNQSGIGRKYFTEQDLQNLNNWLIKTLKERGININQIYHCPHLPEDSCSCRKPKIGMILQAVEDFGINLSESWLIGDSNSDILAGAEANLKTIKISNKPSTSSKVEASYQVDNLLKAIKIILS